MTTDALIEQIRRAFADVPYPGDEDLAVDSYGEEPDALERAFRGLDDWRVLDPAFLDDAPEGWGSALSFFSDAAFRFYLPAFLVAHLRGREFRSDPAEALSIGLAPGDDDQRIAQRWGGGTLAEHARRRFAPFETDQVRAIVAYLWWWLDAYSDYDVYVTHAMESYWLGREAELQP